MDEELRELAVKVAEWPASMKDAINIIRDVECVASVTVSGETILLLNRYSEDDWSRARQHLSFKATPQPFLPPGFSWDKAPGWANALIRANDDGPYFWVPSFDMDAEVGGEHVTTRHQQTVSTSFGHLWQLIATRPKPMVEMQSFDLAREAGEALVNICHRQASKAGWWTHVETGLDLIQVINAPKDEVEKLLAAALVAQKICLSHSELSEAMEGHRKGLMDDKIPTRKMLEVELADAVIRIADLAGALYLDLGGAIEEKLVYNASRPDHKPEARRAAGGKAY